jgi:maltose O-acetyltransferase
MDRLCRVAHRTGKLGWPDASQLRAPLERRLRRVLQRLRGEQNLDRLVADGLELGHGAFVARGAYLDSNHPWLISIGDDSGLSPGVIVMAHDASMKHHVGCTRIACVEIGKRVFIGVGAIILPGTRIGDDSVVGAGAVVRGDVPPGSLVVGNPARVVQDMASVARWHGSVARSAPVWPHDGWTIDQGITDARKRAQREALAGGTSGYLDKAPTARTADRAQGGQTPGRALARDAAAAGTHSGLAPSASGAPGSPRDVA